MTGSRPTTRGHKNRAVVLNSGGGLRSKVTRRIEERIVAESLRSVRYIHPVSPRDATGLVAEVYLQLATDFQIVAPMVMHSPNPKLLAGVWSITRETLIVGSVPRSVKEAVATGVSWSNECPYCVDVHALMLDGAGENQAGQALRSKGARAVNDPTLRRAALWGSGALSRDKAVLQSAPFGAENAAEMIGVAVCFHYLNRVVNVFLAESPLPLPPALGWLKGMLAHIGAATFAKRIVEMSPSPGSSLALLPQVEPLPKDLGWAAPNPFVAGAFARFAAAIEDAARDVIPRTIRELVTRRVAAWSGEPPGLSREWAARAVQGLDRHLRPMATFALLTALASYQVDGRVIEEFRRDSRDDSECLATAAWSAFTAARRVGTWIWSAQADVFEAPEPPRGEGLSSDGGQSR